MLSSKIKEKNIDNNDFFVNKFAFYSRTLTVAAANFNDFTSLVILSLHIYGTMHQ